MFHVSFGCKTNFPWGTIKLSCRVNIFLGWASIFFLEPSASAHLQTHWLHWNEWGGCSLIMTRYTYMELWRTFNKKIFSLYSCYFSALKSTTLLPLSQDCQNPFHSWIMTSLSLGFLSQSDHCVSVIHTYDNTTHTTHPITTLSFRMILDIQRRGPIFHLLTFTSPASRLSPIFMGLCLMQIYHINGV